MNCSADVYFVVVFSLFFIISTSYAFYLNIIFKNFACFWTLSKWQQNLCILLQLAYFSFNNILWDPLRQLIYFQCCTNSTLTVQQLIHSASHFCIFGMFDGRFCLFDFCYYLPGCHIHSYACFMISMWKRLGCAVCPLFKTMPSHFAKQL